MTQRQVEGINDLLDEWERVGTGDNRHLSYILATDYHETGAKMQPVRETFATSDAKARKGVARRKYGKPEGPWGHVYYGRGDVQLTWYENYVRMGDLLGLPLAENPDLALKSSVSKRILIEGMLRGESDRGDFTGKSLEEYFNETVDDPWGARRVVNGTDKAHLIAGYHDEFLEAVEAAQQVETVVTVDELAPAKLPPAKDPVSWGGAISTVTGAAGALTALIDRVDDPYALGAFAVIMLGLVVGAVLIFRGRINLVRETGE
ncbi:glycoside hydrolase family 19 protein [Shimia sp.]|uniref:glycoside hydrolase family 19 protein n=1 Tax=Shimia sp. TaxID=1954381 RepID=UPI0032976E7F